MQAQKVLGYLILTLTMPLVSLPLDVSQTLMPVPSPAIMILSCIQGLFLRGLMWMRSPCCVRKEGVCWLRERILLTPQQGQKTHLHLPVKAESTTLQQNLRLGFLPLAIKLHSHRITRPEFLKPFVWISNSSCAGSKF